MKNEVFSKKLFGGYQAHRCAEFPKTGEQLFVIWRRNGHKHIQVLREAWLGVITNRNPADNEVPNPGGV